VRRQIMHSCRSRIPGRPSLRGGDEWAVAVAEQLVAVLAQRGVADGWWQDPPAGGAATLLLHPVDPWAAPAGEGVERGGDVVGGDVVAGWTDSTGPT